MLLVPAMINNVPARSRVRREACGEGSCALSVLRETAKTWLATVYPHCLQQTCGVCRCPRRGAQRLP